MNDPKSSEMTDPRSERELRRCLEALRGSLGPCPDTQRLELFSKHMLLGAEFAEIERHVDSCGVCDSLLERMKEFDSVFKLDDIGARGNRKLASSILALFRHPVFAYCLVLALIYPAYLGLSGRQQVDRNPPPPQQPIAPQAPLSQLDSAQVLQLDVTRGAETRPDQGHVNSRYLILTFTAPIRPGYRYSADLSIAGGRTVVLQHEITSYDGKGNFQLVCERGLFSQGEYVLTVSEIDPGTHLAVPAFRFPFAL